MTGECERWNKKIETSVGSPGLGGAVEQPMKFDFIVNLKTAKQIGVTIPQWTLMKADRVIR